MMCEQKNKVKYILSLIEELSGLDEGLTADESQRPDQKSEQNSARFFYFPERKIRSPKNFQLLY